MVVSIMFVVLVMIMINRRCGCGCGGCGDIACVGGDPDGWKWGVRWSMVVM